MDDIIGDKCFIGWFNVRVGGSVYWVVDIIIADGVSSSDGIRFGIDDGYEMGYYIELLWYLELRKTCEFISRWNT